MFFREVSPSPHSSLVCTGTSLLTAGWARFNPVRVQRIALSILHFKRSALLHSAVCILESLLGRRGQYKKGKKREGEGEKAL